MKKKQIFENEFNTIKIVYAKFEIPSRTDESFIVIFVIFVKISKYFLIRRLSQEIRTLFLAQIYTFKIPSSKKSTWTKKKKKKKVEKKEDAIDEENQLLRFLPFLPRNPRATSTDPFVKRLWR